jgi:hypothetical protein
MSSSMNVSEVSKAAARVGRILVAVAAPLLVGLGACASPPKPPGPDLQQIRDNHDDAQRELDHALDAKGKDQGGVKTGAPSSEAPPEALPPPRARPDPGADVAVSHASGKPPWVETPNDRHPDAQYLAAVGAGNTQNAAQDRAKAEIAKIFEAKIRGVSETFTEFTMKAGQKDLAVKASSLVQVSTDKALRGVQIAASWAGGDTTYSLAVIERAPAARIMRGDIERLDGEIRSKMKAGDGAGDDKVTAFRAYGAALEKLGEREGLNVDLKILERGGGVVSPVSWEDIVSKFDTAEENLKVGLAVEAVVRIEEMSGAAPDEQARIQSCLLQELGKMGLQVVDDDEGGYDLLLKARADFAPVDVVSGMALVRVDLALDVSDAKKKKTLKTWTETEGRVSRPNWRAAISTAATKICQRSVPNIALNLKKLMTRP